jgi:hypothetical protein
VVTPRRTASLTASPPRADWCSHRSAHCDTKVIGRFPGETSCLTLVWAVLDLYISHATNGINFTQLERQRLNRMRYEGHEHTTPEEVTAA